MSGTYQNPTEFFILLAPAVSLFLVLSSRQPESRLSLGKCGETSLGRAEPESTQDDTRKCRIENLCSRTTYYLTATVSSKRVTCYLHGSGVLGIWGILHLLQDQYPLLIAEYSHGSRDVVVLYEIGRAADTLWLELAFCEWIRSGRHGEQPPKLGVGRSSSSANH